MPKKKKKKTLEKIIVQTFSRRTVGQKKENIKEIATEIYN